MRVWKFVVSVVQVCLFGWVLCGYALPVYSFVPEVIPALRQWKSGSGICHLPVCGVIRVSESDSLLLADCAAVLSSDLKDLSGREYTVCFGKEPSEIHLVLSDEGVPSHPEGYVLEVSDKVTIRARTPRGVFWGTRTLLQMLCLYPDGIPLGEAFDYPAYESRGFMLDVGRKFFTMDFLKQYVRILSFYKMNEFQIHLNDNGFVEFFGNDWKKTYAAFRLESESFPGLSARDGSYSKQEFRDFQIYAARYGVTVIPEIDVPAHSLAFTLYNPRLAASDSLYGMDHLDLYKDEVYQFLDTLFAEYLSGPDPVFVGPYVHIGTDEYNLKEAERFRYFTDRYLRYIRSFGKQPRMWGSLGKMGGNTPVWSEGVTVNIWNSDWFSLSEAVRKGYKVINTCDAYLYIVPAVNYYHDYLDTRWLYEYWTPEQMSGEECFLPVSPSLAGAMFAVWNDRVGNGISMHDVHVRAFPAVQTVAGKLWSGSHCAGRVPYHEFQSLCSRLPEAPGVNLSARVNGTVCLTVSGEEIILGRDSAFYTSVPEIGYPYSVEFEIRSDTSQQVDALLFRGPHSEFIVNWNNTGKFAFRRDGYEFVFHAFRLQPEVWTKVRIEGDSRGTSLFIDGTLIERLEGRIGQVYNQRAKRSDYIWYQETLVFPLKEIGGGPHAFRGSLRNVVCRNIPSSDS